VEELKTSPNELVETSAPLLAAQALDNELNAGLPVTSTPAVVNDLTSMVVKKKKKGPEETKAPKRKAGDDAEESNTEKKARTTPAP